MMIGKENEWSDPRIAHGEEKKAVVGREELVVSKPPAFDKKGQPLAAKFNPVSHWKVSKQAINGELFLLSCFLGFLTADPCSSRVASSLCCFSGSAILCDCWRGWVSADY